MLEVVALAAVAGLVFCLGSLTWMGFVAIMWIVDDLCLPLTRAWLKRTL